MTSTKPEGYVFGRPREWDRSIVAQDLITWAKLDSSTNLNGFCSDNLIPPSKISEWARACKDFRLAFELAKSFLAKRREEKLSKGTLHVKAYDLNVAVYDHFTKEDRKEQAAYEASLKVEKPEDSEKTKDAVTALNRFSDSINA